MTNHSQGRAINKTSHTIDTKPFATLPADLRAWLEEYAARDQGKLRFRWLLAHCDDGVIWGELRDGTLHLSSDAFPMRGLALRGATLQQARLFGSQAELLIWRGPRDQWHASLRRDDQGDEVECIDEPQLLWGYLGEDDPPPPEHDGFVQLHEGSQGIVHAPPLGDSPLPTEQRRVSLLLRHYLAEDPDTGVVRIGHSRLVKVCTPP